MLYSNKDLKLYYKDVIIFSSQGKGLQPMVDAFYFKQRYIQSSLQLSIYDKVMGRVAAFFVLVMGIDCVSCEVLSQDAQFILEEKGIIITRYKKLVTKLKNDLDEKIMNINDPEKAVKFVLDNQRFINH